MKTSAIPLFLMLLALPAAAEDKPPLLFRIMTYTAPASIFIDTGMTYYNIGTHRAVEQNPFWASIMDRPALVLTLDVAITASIHWGAKKLYPRNKTLAWALVIGVHIVQGYCIYNNIRYILK